MPYLATFLLQAAIKQGRPLGYSIFPLFLFHRIILRTIFSEGAKRFPSKPGNRELRPTTRDGGCLALFRVEELKVLGLNFCQARACKFEDNEVKREGNRTSGQP